MSTTTTDDNIVQRFTDLTSVRHADKILHDDEIDGDGWLWGRRVVLCDEDVTHVAEIPFETYTDADYIETRTVGGDEESARVYGFRAGHRIHWVDVQLLRRLANDVFDVDYATIRSWAQTTTDESVEHDGDAPVLFDAPDSAYSVLVMPTHGPNE